MKAYVKDWPIMVIIALLELCLVSATGRRSTLGRYVDETLLYFEFLRMMQVTCRMMSSHRSALFLALACLFAHSASASRGLTQVCENNY